jgi:tetratricopeptide (TPR) repeat protein/transcriptional regulator with XRE-family HTH domain
VVDNRNAWRLTRQRFGEALAALRLDAGLSQSELASAMTSETKKRISNGTFSDLERGIGANPPRRDVVLFYLKHCLPRWRADAAPKEERRADVLRKLEALEALHETLKASGVKLHESAAQPNDLPRDAHAFTGREDELTKLVDAVENGGVVAVHAVDGMPGVGKTAFAVRAAHLLADRFPDGQIFLDLYGHTAGHAPLEPHDALASLLMAVGVESQRLPADTAKREALWRRKLGHKRMVVILDNAADHAQVAPLLPGGGGCLVLVTSRRRLVELDAVTIDLAPLATAEAERMFQRLAGREVTEPLADLVELAGRLPLALAILAARFRNRAALTVAVLLTELRAAHGRLSGLQGGERAVAAAFDLSYRDLSPQRQHFFRLLGLHPGGGVEQYAAAALCDVELDEAAGHLDGLYHEHLVDEIAFGRFRMHDLIAEYAAGLVDDSDDPDKARRSLLDFYADAATNAYNAMQRYEVEGGTLPPIEGPEDARAWFDDERVNVLASFDSADDAETVVRLALSLAPYLRRTGPWDLSTRIMRRAAEFDVEAHNGDVQLELGKAEFTADNYLEAETALQKALDVFEATGRRTFCAHALMALGQLWIQTGYHSDAREALTQALGLYEQDGDQADIANVLTELALLSYYGDEYEQAVDIGERALTIFRELGDEYGQAMALKGLSNSWLFRDRYDDAYRTAVEGLELYKRQREAHGATQLQSQLGSIERSRGRYTEAYEHFAIAIEGYEELGDRGGKAQALVEQGIVLGRLGRFTEAEQVLREALDLYETFGEEHGRAASRRELAELLIRAGRLAEARVPLDESDVIYGKLDDRYGKTLTSTTYGTWYLKSGDARKAQQHYEQALLLAVEIGGPLAEADALAGLGRAAKAQGDQEGADRQLRKALAIYQRIGAGEAAELAEELA